MIILSCMFNFIVPLINCMTYLFHLVTHIILCFSSFLSYAYPGENPMKDPIGSYRIT